MASRVIAPIILRMPRYWRSHISGMNSLTANSMSFSVEPDAGGGLDPLGQHAPALFALEVAELQELFISGAGHGYLPLRRLSTKLSTLVFSGPVASREYSYEVSSLRSGTLSSRSHLVMTVHSMS